MAEFCYLVFRRYGEKHSIWTVRQGSRDIVRELKAQGYKHAYTEILPAVPTVENGYRFPL